VEVVASLSQGPTAAAQCGLFTHKSVPVIFEPTCYLVLRRPEQRWLRRQCFFGGQGPCRCIVSFTSLERLYVLGNVGCISYGWSPLGGSLLATRCLLG